MREFAQKFAIILALMFLGFVGQVFAAEDNTYCNSSNVVINLSADGPAQPLQTCLNTAMANTPSPGTTVHILASDSLATLQNAINVAACGVTIAVAPGWSQPGSLTLTGHHCSDAQWNTLIADTAASNLPAPGTRLTPCYAGVSALPGRPAFACNNPVRVIPQLRLSASNSKVAASGDHWRVIGFEIVQDPSAPIVFTGVDANGGSKVIFDRVWIHGQPTTEFSSAFSAAGGSNIALIDSTITDAKCKAVTGQCTEGHGIIGGTGNTADKTFKFVDNFIEASGEDFIFGGGPATTTPHDIEFRRNQLFKPLIWDKSDPNYFGTEFIVKNHFECKNCDTLLYEGNTAQNVWGGYSQVGAAILLTPKNQNGQCPGCYVLNATIRYSTVSYAAQGFQFANAPSDTGAMATGGGSYSIHDIVIDHLNWSGCYKCGTFESQLSDSPNTTSGFALKNVRIANITQVPDQTASWSGGFLTLGGQAGMPSITWINSIVDAGVYGPWSTGQGANDCATSPVGPLEKFNSCFAAGYSFTGNVIARGSTIQQGHNWPTGNQFPANMAAVQFVNLTGGDYHLAATSPYLNSGTGGTTPGADIDTVASYVNGVVATPPSDPSKNNTSACKATGDRTYCTIALPRLPTNPTNSGAQTQIVDAVPTHISEQPVSDLLYSGAQTRYIAAYQPWFKTLNGGRGNHIDIGYDQSNITVVAAQAAAMIKAGFNSNSIDYYGTASSQAFLKTVTDQWKTYLSTNAPLALDGTPFTMHIMMDGGALNPFCTPNYSNWSSGTNYAIGDGAIDGATAYRATAANTNKQPSLNPGQWETMATCLTRTLNAQFDTTDSQYSDVGGSIPAWYESYDNGAGPQPLYETFITESNWANVDWNAVRNAVHSHVAGYSHVPLMVWEYGDFTKQGTDGAYAWVRAIAWNVTNQLCWTQPNGCSNPFDYFADFYNNAISHPTKVPIGVFVSGFDDHNASWGTNRVVAQQCGQLMALSGAYPGAHGFGVGNQLPYMMKATWNDYEEGTEMESGISNCYLISASVTGTTLNWTMIPTGGSFSVTSTIHHFNIWYTTTQNSTLQPAVVGLSSSARSISLTNLLPPGAINVYVEMVGTAGIQNVLSTPVPLTVPQPPSGLVISSNPNWIGSVFVSPSGSDSNDCSPASPCQTPQHATTVVMQKPAGQRIVLFRGCPKATPYCGSGTYYLGSTWTLTSAHAGTVQNPVIYASYPGEVPIISGGQRVTGWTNDGSACTGSCTQYHKDLTGVNNFEGLFYNGVRRFRPRSTTTFLRNAGPVCVVTSSTRCPTTAQGNPGCAANQFACLDRLKYANTDIPTGLHDEGIGDVVLYNFEFWTVPTMRLAASGGDGTNPCTTSAVTHIQCLTGSTASTALHGFLVDTGTGQGHRYILENGMPGVDPGFTATPGLWYLDRCPTTPNCTTPDATWRLYYWAAGGENPNSDIVEITQQTQLLTMTGADYNQFWGLTFAHDNWVVPAAGLAAQQGLPTTSAAILITDTAGTLFDQVTIRNTQGWGLSLQASGSGTGTTNTTVWNSLLADMGAGAIRIGDNTNTTDTDTNVANNTVVQNNQIQGTGRKDPSGIGMAVWMGNTWNNLVDHNKIIDIMTGGVGLGFNLGSDTTGHGCGGAGCIYGNVVSYNEIGQIGNGTTLDFAGVYTADSHSFRCDPNWVWNTGLEQMTGTPCNQITHNYIHDITHAWTEDDVAVGANGIYHDQGSANNYDAFNLILRPSQAGIFNNLSNIPDDQYIQRNWYDNNIVAYAGSTLAQQKETIHRGGDNPESLYVTHTIFYNNGKNTSTCNGGRATFQNCPGKWSAFDCSGNPVASSTRYFFDNNLLFDRLGNTLDFVFSTPNTPANLCTVGGTLLTYSHLSFANWQGTMGQDVHSQNKDPQFVNPTYPADNYLFAQQTNIGLVGITAFNFTDAGLFNAGSVPTLNFSLPEGFPTNPLNPNTDY